MARGIHSQSVAQEFLDHSNEEQGHAEYAEGDTLASMIREDLVAERIAIDSYRDIIAYLGDQDPTTRRLVEGILAVEEQHADELADLLVAFPPSSLESTASGCSVQPVAVSSVARLA
jgi:bacterioferritin